MSETVIEFKNVTKIYKLYKSDKQRLKALIWKKTPYKEKKAVNNVSFKIERGDSVALFGRNGAGKTTLLSIMTAQNPATSGTVTLDGMPVWENQKALDHLCFSRELNHV